MNPWIPLVVLLTGKNKGSGNSCSCSTCWSEKLKKRLTVWAVRWCGCETSPHGFNKSHFHIICCLVENPLWTGFFCSISMKTSNQFLLKRKDEGKKPSGAQRKAEEEKAWTHHIQLNSGLHIYKEFIENVTFDHSLLVLIEEENGTNQILYKRPRSLKEFGWHHHWTGVHRRGGATHS